MYTCLQDGLSVARQLPLVSSHVISTSFLYRVKSIHTHITLFKISTVSKLHMEA